jgi:hypothetical protein
MKKSLLALALLATVATTTVAIDRKTGTKKAARKAKTECPAKTNCCPGMKSCAQKMTV